MSRVKMFTYNGDTGTIPFFARKYGIGITTLGGRIRRGYTIEQAINTPLYGAYICHDPGNKGGPIRIEYNGETHTFKEWGAIRRINPERIRSRLYHGWTVAQALGYEDKEHYSAESLCWDCKRTSLNCEWVRSLRPVRGWKAKVVFTEGEYRNRVLECPKFKEG